jgi:hypothetical protein
MDFRSLVTPPDATLADMLIENAKRNTEVEEFWHYELLTRITTRERIENALSFECPGLAARLDDVDDIKVLAHVIGPIYKNEKGKFLEVFDDPPIRERTRFLKVFVILILECMGQYILEFIQRNIGDDDIPLYYRIDDLPLHYRLDTQQSEPGRTAENQQTKQTSNSKCSRNITSWCDFGSNIWPSKSPSVPKGPMAVPDPIFYFRGG